jgi:hypothetical protein
VEIIEPADGPVLGARVAVLACAPALAPHVEFALARAVGGPVSLDWSPQRAVPGSLCAHAAWRGPAGHVERVVAALRGVPGVPFEVTSDAHATCDAARWVFHPDLGLHHATLDALGQVVVGEGQLRALLGRAPDGSTVAQGVSRLLGDAWDEALEPLRLGGNESQETRLRPTG